MIKQAPGIAVVLFALDRLSKQWISHALRPNESKAIVEHFFYLTRVENTGAAFGAFKGAQTFLSLAAVAVLLGIARGFMRHHKGLAVRSQIRPADRWSIAAWTLIAAGACGNLYDRMAYGHVIDFIDFKVWPVFNFADIFICTGAGLLALRLFGRRDP